jgi:type VI secretion system secreted protein VgrG
MESGKAIEIGIEAPSFKEGDLDLVGLSGREAMSEPFRFSLELLSERHDLKADDLVGATVDVWMVKTSGTKRFFNGVIRAFAAGARQGDGRRAYRAEMVPALWMLGQRSDCRVFQNMGADKVIEEVLKDAGVANLQNKITGSLPKREYCVQYRETDLDFISRLMEEEGIYYYFKHEKGKHHLVLAQTPSAYFDGEDKDLIYDAGGREDLVLDHWSHAYRVIPAKWVQADYSTDAPAAAVLSNAPTRIKLKASKDLERFDYPGGYTEKRRGDTLTGYRMEVDEAAHEVVTAAGTYRTLEVGGKFSVSEHEIKSEESDTWVITSMEHSASGEGVDYRASFTAIPAKTPFRSGGSAPKPVVHGMQVAMVTGPKGEIVHTDEQGRVKVQFYWDREGQKDEKTSCWVRVAQATAGGGWGSMFVPRVGHEVLVSFLEGDPDRPVVTGSMYNGTNKPPFKPSEKKGWSGITTDTLGSDRKGNEFRLDDTDGKEQIYFYALKDYERKVEHNDKLTLVKGDRTVELTEGNLSTTLKKGDSTFELDEGGHTVTLKNGDLAMAVKKGKSTLNVDASIEQKSKKITLKADTKIEIVVGGNSIEISTSGITLKAADNKIQLKPGTMKMEGTQVEVKGTAMAKLGAPMTNVQSNGILNLKGSLTKIN